MTVTTSWDVFEDLRYAQDELLRMTRMPAQWLAQMGPQSGGGYAGQAWAPAVDITEREDIYLVTAEVPGVAPADLEVTFQDGLLTIQGERRHPADAVPSDKAHRAERRYGAFRRSITLPGGVQADKIDATTQDGVLRILVPKTGEARARHIQVLPGRAKPAVATAAVGNDG
jgi:HSP20 family protein